MFFHDFLKEEISPNVSFQDMLIFMGVLEIASNFRRLIGFLNVSQNLMVTLISCKILPKVCYEKKYIYIQLIFQINRFSSEQSIAACSKMHCLKCSRKEGYAFQQINAI